jgi:hypothetical protein
MIGLFDCKGKMVSRSMTMRGIRIAEGKRMVQLWDKFNETKQEDRKEKDLVHYTKVLIIQV